MVYKNRHQNLTFPLQIKLEAMLHSVPIRKVIPLVTASSRVKWLLNTPAFEKYY